MTEKVELIIHNASQLVTCAGSDSPKRGTDMQNVGLIEEGAVAIANGQIVALGESRQILAGSAHPRRLWGGPSSRI